MSDPRQTVIDVLHGELGACITRDVVHTYSGLQAAWEAEAPPEFVWWFIEVFVGDPRIYQRMRRAYNEIGRTFVDLERLHYAMTGTAVKVDPRVVEVVRRRVLNAWFPESYEVLNEATGACAERAAHYLKKYTKAREWLESF